MSINKVRDLKKQTGEMPSTLQAPMPLTTSERHTSSTHLENPHMQSSSPIPLSDLPLNNPISLPPPSFRKGRASEPPVFNRQTKKRMLTPDGESEPGSPQSPENYEYVAEKGYAPFIKKLYDILDKPAYNSIIYWCEDGKTFEVANQFELCEIVLPYYYKHKNMSSFVRQLNLYGFTKIQNLRQGVLNAGADSEKYKFMHPKFQRGRPELLGQVKRKLPDGSKELNRFEPPVSDLSHIFSELESIKKNQRSIKEQLKDFQSTNEELSKTIQQVLLKYHEQNDVINMIRRFLGLFFADKPLEKLPRKQQLLLERPGAEDSYTPMSTSEQAANLQKLIFDLGNNHPGNAFASQAAPDESLGNTNDLWLNPNQSIQLPDYINQGAGAQQGALVPMPSSPASLAQLARLAGVSQNANASINNLRRVTDSIDNSIANTQEFLGDKATQDQAKSLAANEPEFLSSYMGSQTNPFNDYAPLFYDLGQYGFHSSAVPSANGTADPLAGFEHASDPLGLGTPANGEDLLANLNSQLPFKEEVSEIMTEPHPALSSTPGSSGSATIFGPQNPS